MCQHSSREPLDCSKNLPVGPLEHFYLCIEWHQISAPYTRHTLGFFFWSLWFWNPLELGGCGCRCWSPGVVKNDFLKAFGYNKLKGDTTVVGWIRWIFIKRLWYGNDQTLLNAPRNVFIIHYGTRMERWWATGVPPLCRCSGWACELVGHGP